MKVNEPILEQSLQEQIEDALVMFRRKGDWKKFGMNHLREQGSAMLFHGPPGTGKTLTARKISRTLHYKMQEMDFSQIGSNVPGELARNIKKLFAVAKVEDLSHNCSLIFMDECDTMLWDRSKLGHSSMWMLEPINALLREIGTFPGLIILATNQAPEFLDAALERRLIGRFEFRRPDFLTRCQLWKAKFPSKLPVQPQNGDVEELAKIELTGAEIENMLITWVSRTMRKDKEFDLRDLKALVSWKKL